MLLFALLEYRFRGKVDSRFWCIKLQGILLGLELIPVLYYTYSGILGKSIDWLNIAIFFLAAGTAFYLETLLFRRKVACSLPTEIALGLICSIDIIFILFTFYPPAIPLFRDPLTGSYGL